MRDRFPSPFDVGPPAGAEGWEELYPYHLVFSEERRQYEDSQFWFHDGVHWSQPLPPWDATFLEYGIMSLSQYNTRHYVLPPALGVDARILNGYPYLSPLAVTDPAEVRGRIAHFRERAGFYYDHWDNLYAAWMGKVRALIEDMETIRFDPLPEREPIEVITSGRGTGSGFDLVVGYHRLVDLALQVWQYHFELLNLGYAAYLDFFAFCKDVFPGMADLSIAKMVAGIDVDLFRPNDELKALARAALELGVAETLNTVCELDDLVREMERTPAGREWLARFDTARYPWFNFSSGSGFYHTDRIWAEHLSIPIEFVKRYVTKLSAGEDIERPVERLRAERDRITAEYASLLDTDEDRRAFDTKLDMARTVFHFVENHNFYVEHWSNAVVWRKMRDLGRVLATAGFVSDPDDVFYLRRQEVPDAIQDYVAGWATGTAPRGPTYWPKVVDRRRAILAVLRTWSPPEALGRPPDVITEPFTVMLWGITSESVLRSLADHDPDAGLRGFAASPGSIEGIARVLSSADGFENVEVGEILVAPVAMPSWGPVFAKASGVVTDIGGVMSHAAIVCREYGIPAVTGTTFATSRIQNGQRILVDGTAGTVTFLD